jgi:16S rRNA (cytosine967-C5)-methyltransferase
MTKTINTRLIVLSILDQILKEDAFSHKILQEVLKEHQDLSKQDRAFITRLVEGTLENLIYIDYVINQFSKTKTHKMKITILNILRMSVYQIKYMESVPDSAACNEAVKLAKKRSFNQLSGFVNGILRNIARNIESISLPDAKKEPIKYLSIAYSFPEWIIELWLKAYDFHTVTTLCEASNSVPQTSIRCNLLKTTPESLKQELEEQNIKVESGFYLPYAFRISNYDHLSAIQAFQEGKFQVQDESSMLIGELAQVHATDNVLDVCAAPGGKSTHLAEKLENKGRIISRDLTDTKTEIIKENMLRLDLKNIQVETFDALTLDKDLIEKMDVVIADLPCSGLGIIRKKPDIKYRIDAAQIQSLIALQRQILSVINQYVKPNGVLIYSTCTINKGENEENVQWFLEEFPFQMDDVSKYLPKALEPFCKEGLLQLLPNQHKTDGFFMSRLRRMV